MGDFKPSELKCRVDIPLGPSVNCAFDESLRDRVLELLTKPVHVYGQGIFKPLTDKLESLQMESIDPLPTLKLGEGDFFRAQSISDLAKQQGVKKIKDGHSLEGGFPSDESIDEFLADIYEARK